jgi:hypothetical protein
MHYDMVKKQYQYGFFGHSHVKTPHPNMKHSSVTEKRSLSIYLKYCEDLQGAHANRLFWTH